MKNKILYNFEKQGEISFSNGIIYSEKKGFFSKPLNKVIIVYKKNKKKKNKKK